MLIAVLAWVGSRVWHRVAFVRGCATNLWIYPAKARQQPHLESDHEPQTDPASILLSSLDVDSLHNSLFNSPVLSFVSLSLVPIFSRLPLAHCSCFPLAVLPSCVFSSLKHPFTFFHPIELFLWSMTSNCVFFSFFFFYLAPTPPRLCLIPHLKVNIHDRSRFPATNTSASFRTAAKLPSTWAARRIFQGQPVI